MEPNVLLALGIISFFGQIYNYKTNAEKTNLKDVGLLREVDSQPYSFEEKDQSAMINHPYTTPEDDTIPDEPISVNSLLKGDTNIVRKKKEAFAPNNVVTTNTEPNQAHNGYAYNQIYNGNGYNQDYNGYGYNQRYNRNGYIQGYNGNGYNQIYNGNRYGQGYNGNGYEQRYNGNVNGNSVNSKVDYLAKRYNENEMDALAPGLSVVNPTKNQRYPLNNRNYAYNVASTSPNIDRKLVYSGGKYPDTLYTYNPKSVVTYRDENSEVLTMNDNHITVVQPARNKVVIHRSYPDYKVTTYRDVPANSDNSRYNNHRAYNYNLNRNFQNTHTSNGFTTPKPSNGNVPAYNGIVNNGYLTGDINTRNYGNSNPINDFNAEKKGNHWQTQNTPGVGQNTDYKGPNYRLDTQNNGYVGPNNGQSSQNNRQAFHNDFSSTATHNNGYVGPNNDQSSQNNRQGFKNGVSSIAAQNNRGPNNGRIGPVQNNGFSRPINGQRLIHPLPTPSVQVAERHYTERMKRSDTLNAYDQVRFKRSVKKNQNNANGNTEWNPSTAPIIYNFDCPKFMQNFTVMGKKVCYTGASAPQASVGADDDDDEYI